MEKNSILVVDDEELSRELLKQIFEDEYKAYIASDGKEAIALLGSHMDEIAVIFLDIMMPVVNGYQVLQVLNARRVVDKIPIVLVTAQKDVKVELACYSLGASLVISKPYAAQAVRMKVDNIIKIFQKSERLEGELKDSKNVITGQQHLLESYFEHTIGILGQFIALRLPLLPRHVERVKEITRTLAQEYIQLYPSESLTRHFVEDVVRASSLHDIGKLVLPDPVICNPKKRSENEELLYRSHTTKGCEMLSLLTSLLDKDAYKLTYNVIRSHHERVDGTGFPDGLSGEALPLEAELVGLADAYDNLVSDHIEGKAIDTETAFHQLMDGKCGAFSPNVLHCLENAKTAIEVLEMPEDDKEENA